MLVEQTCGYEGLLVDLPDDLLLAGVARSITYLGKIKDRPTFGRVVSRQPPHSMAEEIVGRHL